MEVAKMMHTMYQTNKLMWDGECTDWDEAYNQAWREIFTRGTDNGQK